MAYFDTKKGSLEEAIKAAVKNETNKNDKSDDGEGLDAVQKDAIKKKFKDRKDKDIDNDGDVDSSDKYLHKRRKAVAKAIAKEENELSEAMSKDMAKKILSMQKGQSFSKIGSGDMVPMVYLSNDERDQLKKEFGRLSRDVPGPSKGITIPNLINLANTGKPSGDYDTEGQGKHLIFKMKRKGTPKTIGDAAKMAGVRLEAYEYGTPEATKHSLKVTPGQSADDWDKQVGVMQEKQISMRGALAKMWGVDEGHNPFKEEEEEKKPKKEGKTMTGKPMTKIDVNPDMKEKKVK